MDKNKAELEIERLRQELDAERNDLYVDFICDRIVLDGEFTIEQLRQVVAMMETGPDG